MSTITRPLSQQAELSTAISVYLDDCTRYKHLAPSTIRRYRISLIQFSGPLLEKEPYLQVQHVPPAAWESWVLKADHLSNKAFNARRSHLSGFLHWLYEEGVLLPSGKHLARVKEKANTTLRPKTYVRAQDMPAVLKAAEAWHPRDRYFLDGLWHSWRRSGEMCSVRVRDVDLKSYPDSPHGRLVWHNAKAHRPNQVLDMSPQLHDCIAEWLQVYADLAGESPKPSWFLFPAIKPEGITVAGKRRRLVLSPLDSIGQPDTIARRAFQAAGIYEVGMACHALRRGSATELYDAMANAGHRNPLRLAMTALDHRSEQQTEGYLNKDRDRRDLALMLDQVYGTGPAAPEPAPEASNVVSMANWHKKTG